MSKEKRSLVEVLNTNRSLVMVLLGIPVIGMLIAVVLLLFKRPDNLIVALGVILFVGIQYIVMMFFFMKKIETMATKEKEQIVKAQKNEPETLSDDSLQLTPEEERILPLKKE